ncbi:hypothetical protein B0H13DRAFT_2302234 [Mycena leptocephala]|nr:hypothetical protein B0H13DRAFT_2302234 [Mycena leptocephala]
MAATDSRAEVIGANPTDTNRSVNPSSSILSRAIGCAGHVLNIVAHYFVLGIADDLDFLDYYQEAQKYPLAYRAAEDPEVIEDTQLMDTEAASNPDAAPKLAGRAPDVADSDSDSDSAESDPEDTDLPNSDQESARVELPSASKSKKKSKKKPKRKRTTVYPRSLIHYFEIYIVCWKDHEIYYSE